MANDTTANRGTDAERRLSLIADGGIMFEVSWPLTRRAQMQAERSGR
jgi:hypothetical protein